ncbi:MAG: hypothetical protein J6I61_04745 [Prevotella sp.]|nr:hypothetical protein [Prevotella sp.]
MKKYLRPKVKVFAYHMDTAFLAASPTTETIPHGNPEDDDFPPRDVTPQAKQNSFWEEDSDW